MDWVTDDHCKVVYINSDWSTVTGQNPNDALGQGWLSAVHVDDRDVAFNILKHATEKETPFRLKYRVTCRDCGFIWILSGAAPSISPDGRFMGFFGAATALEGVHEAGGTVGARHMSPATRTPSQGSLELIADHLLAAHFIAREAAETTIVPSIESSLTTLGRRLAETAREDRAVWLN